jgi:hypothetical protein
VTSPAKCSETTDSDNFQRMICNKKAKTVNSRTACPFSDAVKFVACKKVKSKKDPVDTVAGVQKSHSWRQGAGPVRKFVN